MGMNNYALYETRCESCHSDIELPILFSFGRVAEHRYKLGDSIVHDSDSNPINGTVVADGLVSYCPICQDDYGGPEEFYIFIQDNLLQEVIPADGRFKIAEASYIILSP